MTNFETTTDLLPYQVDAVNKLLPTRIGAEFMAMGTGKTRTIIELVKLRQRKIDKVVYFCPVSLKATVKMQLFEHTTLTGADIYIFDDKTNTRNIPDASWYIVGIESMSDSIRIITAVNKLVTEHTFVIVDESSYIKGHYAWRTRRITRICERARYRSILTGTPISQGVIDLYSQMYFLSPKILGYSSFYSFAANHLEYSDKFPGMIVRSHNLEYIAAKIKPYVYQITKEEALNLLPKLYETRYFYMSDEQRQTYEDTKNKIFNEWELADDSEISSIMIFRLFSALQQIISGFYNERLDKIKRGKKREEKKWKFHTFENSRLKGFMDAIDEVPPNDKIVTFCKFQYDVDSMRVALEHKYGPDSYSYFCGRLSQQERNWQIEKFKSESRFFIVNQASGGHGLNLQDVAHFEIFYNDNFKYSEREQAEDRCHRLGQLFPVTCMSLHCINSIDDRIAKALAKKGNAVEAFKDEINRVKKDRIRELIKAL
jgi:SNF2 family DNA or RNA helicase